MEKKGFYCYTCCQLQTDNIKSPAENELKGKYILSWFTHKTNYGYCILMIYLYIS